MKKLLFLLISIVFVLATSDGTTNSPDVQSTPSPSTTPAPEVTTKAPEVHPSPSPVPSPVPSPSPVPEVTTKAPEVHPSPSPSPQPVDGSWSDWSECSKSCGGGTYFNHITFSCYHSLILPENHAPTSTLKCTLEMLRKTRTPTQVRRHVRVHHLQTEETLVRVSRRESATRKLVMTIETSTRSTNLCSVQ